MVKKYIYSELYRIKHIRMYIALFFITILFQIATTAFLSIISLQQTEPTTKEFGLYSLYMLIFIGFYLAYPIVICANTVKPKYVERQILSSGITKNILYFSDLFYINIIQLIMLVLYSVSSIISTTLLLESAPGAEDSLDLVTVKEFIIIMCCIYITMILSSIVLYSLQLVLSNKIFATGLFMFLVYVIPLVIAQIRYFSDIADSVAQMIPFLQVAFFYKGDSPLSMLLLIHGIWIAVTIMICNTIYNKIEA